MARTSEQWWAEVRRDPERLVSWLVRQYHAEARAARGIADIAERYAPDPATKRIMMFIVEQERKHAEMVLDLLRARGVEPPQAVSESRYWREMLPEVTSFSTGAGAVAHAEKMSLERIYAIVDDLEGPEDIREAFQLILIDERFHEAAFREMAGPEGMETTLPKHRVGRAALGLEP